MRYLRLREVLALHQRIIAQSGGAAGIRDVGALESAVAQPRATFEGIDLYPSLEEKAVALGFALIQNHAFVDGNKRIGHAALEVFLMLNGHELVTDVDEAEAIILGVASSRVSRDELLEWAQRRIVFRVH